VDDVPGVAVVIIAVIAMVGVGGLVLTIRSAESQAESSRKPWSFRSSIVQGLIVSAFSLFGFFLTGRQLWLLPTALGVLGQDVGDVGGR
jgi:hypothetical protein